MMRVLLVSEPGVDGVFRHVEGLALTLLERGHQVDFAYSSVRLSDRAQDLVGRVKAAGGLTMDMRVSALPGWRDWPALIRLRRLISVGKCDIIHGHSSKAGALVRLLRLTGVRQPIFYTPNAYYGMRNSGGMREWVFNRIEGALGRVGTTINVSADEADFARGKLGLSDGSLLLIPNGVDVATFAPVDSLRRASLRGQFGIPEGKRVLGAVGRLCYQKDPETLYRAFALAAERVPDLLLWHVGSGELEEEMAALARALGIGDRVIRNKYFSELSSFYQCLDGFILTSRYEGLPFSALEALACDLPVILSDAPGNAGFASLGLSHYWSASAGASSAFAEAISAWARVSDGGIECNHRKTAFKLFDQKVCYGSILDEYARAAGQLR